jgi:hypothetical protein
MDLQGGGRGTVAEIFFSYSRKDRERVGAIRDALAEMGFDVFWDQETPSGSDWDTWIRGELAKSKCAVVFWSATSTVSDNVRHEAVVAKEQRKLISVFLDQLPAGDLPMGLYTQQAADLSNWNGDQEHDQWRKFRSEFEAKLMPRWVQQKLNSVDAELEGERARRKIAEARERALRAQITKEAGTHQELKSERDYLLADTAELKATLEERARAFQAQIEKEIRTQEDLTAERERAFEEIARLKAAIEERERVIQSETDKVKEASGERDRALAEVEELKAALRGQPAKQLAAEQRDTALKGQTAKQLETQQSLKAEPDRASAEPTPQKREIGFIPILGAILVMFVLVMFLVARIAPR